MNKLPKTATTSRRSFLSRSAFTAAAGAVGALGVRTALAQGPPVGDDKSVVNLSSSKMVQITTVVKDVQKVARRFSEVWGPSWKFYDMRYRQTVLHDKELKGADCYVKLAIGNFGGRSIKLVQPVSGQSSYMEFLEKHGECNYTIGLNASGNHDRIVDALKKAGVGIEMQGDLGNGFKFTIMDTVEDVGCRIEVATLAVPSESSIRQTGVFVQDKPSVVNMDKPIFAGGNRINTMGIVVKDEKRVAQRFGELFGISEGWRIGKGPQGLVNVTLNEKPVPESDIPSVDVAMANGSWGDMRLEIIRPVGIRPGGCHQWFLDKHGNGHQHVNVDNMAEYNAVVDTLKKAGVPREFSAEIGKRFGASYIDQKQFGGFQIELTGSPAS